MVKNPNFAPNTSLYVACRTTRTYWRTFIAHHLYIIFEDKKVIMDSTYNIMSNEWRTCTPPNTSAV